MIVTRLERQKIEERLSIIFQLIEFFGEEGEDDILTCIHVGECNSTMDTNVYGFLQVRMDYS